MKSIPKGPNKDIKLESQNPTPSWERDLSGKLCLGKMNGIFFTYKK